MPAETLPPTSGTRGGGRHATRDRLVACAFELFAREGFHAVGLDRILADAGISKQTFYNHFESKDELVEEVLRFRDAWEMRTTRDLLRQFAGGEEPCAQLYAVFDMLHAWFTDPAFQGCLFMNAAAEFPNPFEPAHQIAADHARSVEALLFDLAARAGVAEPGRLAEELTVVIHGAIAVRHITGNTDAAAVARRFGEPLLDRYLGCGVGN